MGFIFSTDRVFFCVLYAMMETENEIDNFVVFIRI